MAVLAAITGKGYEGLEIADGGTASNEYLRLTFGENIEESDRTKVRTNLEKTVNWIQKEWYGLLMNCGSSSNNSIKLNNR